ncbi:hypothetical protein Vretifemale_13717, partial [Volvox reticuliferus]
SSKGGGTSNAAGGGNATSLTSGESFRAPGSTAMLRLVPTANAAIAAAAAAAQQNSPQSQRPFSSFLPLLDATTMSLGAAGNPSTVAAALAAAEVEMAAAFAQYSSMGQAPWSNGGPRPMMSLMNYDWFRNAPTHGSSAVDWRPWDIANNPALRMGRGFRRQSAEGIGPWDSPAISPGQVSGAVAPAAATPWPPSLASPWAAGISAKQQGPPGQGDSLAPDGQTQSYAYGMWGGSNTIGHMPPQQMSWWNAQMRAQSQQVWLPQPPAVLRVGGELLERSVSLSPPQQPPHPLRVPMAYLAASRSAGAGGYAAAPQNTAPPLGMQPLKPPPKPQECNGTAAATATSTTTLGTTTSSAVRYGRRCPPVKCASIGPSSLIRPFPEMPYLPRTTGGETSKASSINTEAPSQLLPMTLEPAVRATVAPVEVARPSPVPDSAQRTALGNETPNTDLSSSSSFHGAATLVTAPAVLSHPLQSPSPRLRPAGSGQAGENSQPVAVAAPVEAQVIRRQYSGFTTLPTMLQPPTPSSLASQLPPPPTQQQAHHRRGAIRTASRLSLVTMDRD